MDDRWFYLEADIAIGPYSWDRLLDLFKVGLISPRTYVWREGDDGWTTLDAARTARRSVPPPPLPMMPDASNASEPQALATSAAMTPWLTSPVAPWRRYGARILDTTINGYIGMFAVGMVWYTFAPASADAFFGIFTTPGGVLLDVIATLILAGLVGALLIGTTGTTIGKAIFGIKVVHLAEDRPIGIGGALKREASVYVFGLGLGIPIVALVAMIVAFNKLKAEGDTSWDAGAQRVLYRPGGTLQTTLNVFGAVLVVLVLVINRMLMAQP